MKPILCVIDLTADSKKVLEAAADIALNSNSSIIILYPFRLINKDKPIDVLGLKTTLESKANETFSSILNHMSQMKMTYIFCTEIGFAFDRIKMHVKGDEIETVVISVEQADSILADTGIHFEALTAALNIASVIVPKNAA